MSYQLDLGIHIVHQTSVPVHLDPVAGESVCAARRLGAFDQHCLASASALAVVAHTLVRSGSLEVVADTDPAAAAAVGTDHDYHVAAEADHMRHRAVHLVADCHRARQCGQEQRPVSEQKPG